MKTARFLLPCAVVACLLAGCDTTVLERPTPTPLPTATLSISAAPTWTPQPTMPPAESPTPIPPPSRPQDIGQYANTIVAYLNDSQGDVDGLRAVLNSWEALRHVADLLSVDVDDDGTAELLLVLAHPSQDYGINLPGDLLVVDREDGTFLLAYSAAKEHLVLDPVLLEVGDLTGDKSTEIAFSSTSCGAHTCFTTVYVVASGAGKYKELTGGGVEMSYVDPQFADWDGDGLPELVMYGGTIGSIGAGPQRARTEVYKWDGVEYTLSETVYDPSNYLYFRVLDANQALLEGDYETAAALYRQAIDDPDLDVWMEEGEREALAAFSRYRLSLTYLLLGQVGPARAALDEILIEQPESIYAQVATVLWETYDSAGDLAACCREVASFALSHPETADVLANFGYGNPSFTPQEVCPLELF